MRPIDEYFDNQPEPIKSCLQALRSYVLNYQPQFTEAWKYGMPFYCYKGKMFCYLWTNKKTGQPYIGIVEGRKLEHPLLIQEKRSRMKIMMFDAEKDLPISTITDILKIAIALY